MGNQLAPKTKPVTSHQTPPWPRQAQGKPPVRGFATNASRLIIGKKPTSGISQPCSGRPGKLWKRQSRPRVHSNQPISGTFLKRAGDTGLLQPQPIPKAATAKREKFLKTTSRHRVLKKNPESARPFWKISALHAAWRSSPTGGLPTLLAIFLNELRGAPFFLGKT